MHETFQEVLHHLRMVWRFRWIGLIAATAVCIGGWSFVLLMPDQFQASTKVFIDTRTLLRPLLRGLAVDANVQNSTDIISRTLLARPNLEQIARKTDLDLTAKTPEAFERLVNGLRSQIRVNKTRRDGIFVIAYEHRDAAVATRVVESVLNLFVERSLGDSRKDTTKSIKFLDEQIKEYEARLIAAENRLKEFKRKNMGLLPGSSGGYFEKRKQQAAARTNAELELREAELRRDELGAQLQDVDEMLELPEGGVDGDRYGHPLDDRIANLERNLDELLIKYTEQHPDVIWLEGQLTRLRTQRDTELTERSAGDAAANAEEGAMSLRRVENPMYQQLKIAVGESEAVVAALQARVESFHNQEQELARLVDRALAVEAEFSRLNRDHGVDKRNYNELVKRREQLDLSEDVSQTTDDVTFNIIEPPRKPITPTSPNRPVLDAAVLGAGLGAGVALAWLLAMLRPTVYSSGDLADVSEYPVLGTVSRLWTARERFRRRLEVASFGVGCTSLFMLFAGLLVAHIYHLDFISRISALGQRFL